MMIIDNQFVPKIAKVLLPIAVLTASLPFPDAAHAQNSLANNGKKVYGMIGRKWTALGKEKGFLGQPLTNEKSTPDKIGRYNHFQGGSIYWTPKTGAHEVHGDIRKKWASLGWERSFLRYPITDERSTPDKVGRFNHFQGGSIYWTPKTGAHEVHGDIRQKWSSLGWERSFLGYPTTDETSTPDGVGRFNHFQGGSIYWTPNTGAHEVHGDIRQKWASLGWERSFLGYPISDELSINNNSRYSVFEGGVLHWKRNKGADIARSFVVPNQILINQVNQYVSGVDERLYITGPTTVVNVHKWYKHGGKTYPQVLELDMDMKYDRKGRNPNVDLDLFMSFETKGNEIQATLIKTKQDVNFPGWFKVASLGIGKIMEIKGEKAFEKKIGDEIGRSVSIPSGFRSLFAVNIQKDASVRVFGD